MHKYIIISREELDQVQSKPTGKIIAKSIQSKVLNNKKYGKELNSNIYALPSFKVQKLDKTKVQKLKSNNKNEIVRSIPIKLIAAKASGKIKTKNLKTNWALEAVGALSSNYDGSGVTVAILDTGINKTHEAFKGIKIVEKDFTDTQEGNGDLNGHGTHCAGIIAGKTYNGFRIGVAPKIKKLLIGKVLNKKGQGSTAALLEGLDWAIKNKANVISLSIGIDFPGLVKESVLDGIPVEYATSKALEEYRKTVNAFESILSSYESRMQVDSSIETFLVVAAAGNESDRTDLNKILSASPPSICKGCISVGAVEKVNDDYKVANFSNDEVAICAPGVDIISASHKGGLISMSGTSMATPFVAGIAALWAQKLIVEQSDLSFTKWLRKIMENTNNTRLKTTDFNAIGEGMIHAPI